ncbi:ribonuclease R [Patescibacteria group bacterium]|nr:MAG: ribonuclease R [Patescibacteria group bacterium]
MSPDKTYRGTIAVSSRKVGYFHVDGFPEDIEIPTPLLNTALHSDQVEIALLAETPGIRRQGEVLKVLTRARLRFVGTLESANGADFFFMKADDRRMYRDIFIHSSKALGAKGGEKVLAEIIGWRDPQKSPEGKVLRVLGAKGAHNVEMEAIVLERGFDSRFPPEAEREAESVAKREKARFPQEIKKRKDFRDTAIFTIDPADAKDFDDALSFRDLGSDNYEVGIHIADVSHYVSVGSLLDREARKRGTSVYLVDRTIPMLPEVLSNDLCSLNPETDRLTFSAVFVMTKDGEVRERWFGKTVIHSKKRFTYEEAQEILDAGRGTFFEELNTLNAIAKILQKKKFENGAIDFETEEIRFELDDEGRPLRVYKKERLETHKLIEEFMLLANREVATFMHLNSGREKQRGAFVYRIHDVPDKEKILNLQIFIKALGYNLRLGKEGEVTAKELNQLFKEIEGKPEESLIKTAAIRAMAKAVYSTNNIGHFGLGFEFYTHFTSPIRRYPDLLVHRLLHRYLTKGKIESEEFAKFEKLAADASEKEVAAADAERASIRYKQVEFMMKRIGETFEGTVSGVSEWGVYVEEKETKAEGMVKVRDMTDDFYVLDEKNYCLVGQSNKKKYSLGDSVQVKLLAADLDRKTLDFAFV